MPTGTPKHLPRDPSDLQTYLSLDEPSGAEVVTLRDAYCDAPEDVDNAHACVDACNEYLHTVLEACLECGAPVRGYLARTCHRHLDPDEPPLTPPARRQHTQAPLTGRSDPAS